jgi:hypothetical protein
MDAFEQEFDEQEFDEQEFDEQKFECKKEQVYTFKTVPAAAEQWMDAFDFEEMLGLLNRRRQKITQRGRLTEAEDAELYHIDEQIERFEKLLSEW